MQQRLSQLRQIDKNKVLIIASIFAILIIIAVYSNALVISANTLYSTDFFKFFQSAQFYFEGQNIYDKIIRPLTPAEVSYLHAKTLILSSDLNPPFFTLLLLPMAWLNYYKGFLVWSVLSGIATIAGILLALKTYPTLWNNTVLRMWVLVAFLVYFPTYANLRFGQVTSILLLLTAATLLACHKQQFRRAGICLGLAFSLKIFYGLFLIFFAARKQWRVVFYMMGTYIVCGICALCVFGIKAYKSYYSSLGNINWYSATWNGSFLGFFSRIFGGQHEGNLPIFNLPQITHPLYLICSAVLALYLIWTTVYPRKLHTNMNALQNNPKIDFDRDYFDWGFSLTIVAMLLITPLGWSYYFPLLIIPFLTILRISSHLSIFNMSLALLSLVMLMSSMPGNYQRPQAIVQTPMILTWASYYFYALALLLLLLIFIRHHLLNEAQQKSVLKYQQPFSPIMQFILYLLAAIPSLVAFGIAF